MDIATAYFMCELRRMVGSETANEWLRDTRLRQRFRRDSVSLLVASEREALSGATGTNSTCSSHSSCDDACETNEDSAIRRDPSKNGEVQASRSKNLDLLRRKPRPNSSSPTRLPTSSELTAQLSHNRKPKAGLSDADSSRLSCGRIQRTLSAGRVQRMIRSGSGNVGLLFTDAAHCCEAEMASLGL